MAKIAPTGMISVPSQGGISHSPKEFTRWQDCANGAEVLYRSILLLDNQLITIDSKSDDTTVDSRNWNPVQIRCVVLR